MSCTCDTKHVCAYLVQFYSGGRWHDGTVCASYHRAKALADEQPGPACVRDRNSDDKIVYQNVLAEMLTK